MIRSSSHGYPVLNRSSSRRSVPISSPSQDDPSPLIRERWLWAATAALSSVYLLQTASPLRLEHDSVIYFRIAMGLLNIAPAPSTGYPVGYPALLAALDRA